VRQSDGAFLLTENLYVNVGARLELSDEAGLTLRLASTRKGFVSIVSYGGVLDLHGTDKAPLRIASWDPLTRGPDTDVGDGRAYLRAIGGRFVMSYAAASDLGFWSGRTGGVGLTGNDLPNSADPAEDGETAQPAAGTDGPAVGNGRFAEPALVGIAGSITHATMRGNAFGLFVGNSRGVSISDVTVENSVRDGVVLHRFGSRAPISRVVSRRNGGDGFVLARATEWVRLDRVSADNNAGNGFTLDGQPLSSAPSVSGDSMASYGPNTVSNSVVKGNVRYGVEVVGGHDVGLLGNRVDGGDMGIVVRAAAARVRVAGNQITGHLRQGIAVREGATAVQVTGNTVAGGETGIYVRDAVARVERNSVRDATQHGVTVVGTSAGGVVVGNIITGSGPRAVDLSRVDGVVDVRDNDVSGWRNERSVWADLRHQVSPMTLLWALIALVVIWTAGRVRRWSRGGQPAAEHPYGDKLPLRSAPPREILPEGRRGGPGMAG
ncbi:MAG TPA: right-handed parallel beta-helix repeat-containing protein, partial [Micromonosporaceae bacterium]|nr:right-handed parallel beta-helix repeat-containing protein [Micromonosporaceae bacterium]